MKVTATVIFSYALLLLVGGWIGHWKAGSAASLIAGLSSGIALALCALAIARGKVAGQYAALGFTLAMLAFFIIRFAKTHSFFPSGMLSLLSLVVLVVIALKIRKTWQLRA